MTTEREPVLLHYDDARPRGGKTLRERYGHIFPREAVWRCRGCGRIGNADATGLRFRIHLRMWHELPPLSIFDRTR